MKNDKDERKKHKPVYPISIVAELIGTTDQTLRLYEKHGLVSPARRKNTRYYSDNDVKWIKCVRDLIHKKKISIPAIKKLLDYAPCWEIKDCPEEQKSGCSAVIEQTKSCWQLNRTICSTNSGKSCEDCVVYLSQKKRVN